MIPSEQQRHFISMFCFCLCLSHNKLPSTPNSCGVAPFSFLHTPQSSTSGSFIWTHWQRKIKNHRHQISREQDEIHIMSYRKALIDSSEWGLGAAGTNLFLCRVVLNFGPKTFIQKEETLCRDQLWSPWIHSTPSLPSLLVLLQLSAAQTLQFIIDEESEMIIRLWMKLDI